MQGRSPLRLAKQNAISRMGSTEIEGTTWAALRPHEYGAKSRQYLFDTALSISTYMSKFLCLQSYTHFFSLENRKYSTA